MGLAKSHFRLIQETVIIGNKSADWLTLERSCLRFEAKSLKSPVSILYCPAASPFGKVEVISKTSTRRPSIILELTRFEGLEIINLDPIIFPSVSSLAKKALASSTEFKSSETVIMIFTAADFLLKFKVVVLTLMLSILDLSHLSNLQVQV